MLRSILLCTLLLTIGIAAHAANDWPERVVIIEEMKALAPMKISVPRLRASGEVKGPVVPLHLPVPKASSGS